LVSNEFVAPSLEEIRFWSRIMKELCWPITFSAKPNLFYSS